MKHEVCSSSTWGAECKSLATKPASNLLTSSGTLQDSL